MIEGSLPVLMIVAGDPVVVSVPRSNTLRMAMVAAALKRAGQITPSERWEVRDGVGALVDLDATVGSLGLVADSRLFANLRAGWGG